MTEYKVALEVYNGPMDLLLYLIRRDEIEISDIPIARITEQYLGYIDLLTRLDPESVSEFLVLAATLMELKSRMLLPRPPVEEGEEEIVDPRVELVRQLLQYKAFKDAAHTLGDAAGRQSRRHPRQPVQTPRSAGDIELDEVEIWDLFDAFNRLLEQTGRSRPVHRVDVDDTPLLLHADDIVDSIERVGGAQPFADIFAGRTLAEMIGLFLALLELIRQRRVRVSQDAAFGPILIHLLSSEPLEDLDDRVWGSREYDDLPSADDAADDDAADVDALEDDAPDDDADDDDDDGVDELECDDIASEEVPSVVEETGGEAGGETTSETGGIADSKGGSIETASANAGPPEIPADRADEGTDCDPKEQL